MSTDPVDYKGIYFVRVSGDDLCGAVPGDPWNCAYARSIKRLHSQITYARVGEGTIQFTDRQAGNRITIRTGLGAEKAQQKFDLDPDGTTVDDFPCLVLNMEDAKVEPIGFNEAKRKAQNARRRAIRDGDITPRSMSEEYKAARRNKRRHA